MSLRFLSLILVLALLLGGAGFLAIWRPPAHPVPTEIPVPNDRLSIQ